MLEHGTACCSQAFLFIYLSPPTLPPPSIFGTFQAKIFMTSKFRAEDSITDRGVRE